MTVDTETNRATSQEPANEPEYIDFPNTPQQAAQQHSQQHQNNNNGSQGQQQINPDENLKQLINEATNTYGFSPESIQGIPAEQLQRLMTDLDRQAFGGFGFSQQWMGQQPFGQQLPYQQFQQPQFQQQYLPPQYQQQQQAQQQQNLAPPNFDDQEIFDEHSAGAFKYLNHQINQMQQMMQMERNQQAANQFFGELESLKKEGVFGPDGLTRQQQESIALAIDQLRLQNPYVDVRQVTRRLARAMNPTANPELQRHAKQRQSQFSGTPARSANGQFRSESADEIIQRKLDEAGASQYEGFL